ncbi:hypothetical protein [Microbispora sp. CA-102843]|uniref:hypothetical protein n=1 Tax=Microbispora sp. CA-102843 TaxID=3239952 RepID=UPI003D946A9C
MALPSALAGLTAAVAFTAVLPAVPAAASVPIATHRVPAPTAPATAQVAAPPEGVRTAPADGATGVPAGRVLIAYLPSSVDPSTATATLTEGLAPTPASAPGSGVNARPPGAREPVGVMVRPLAGQHALAIVPTHGLSPGRTYTSEVRVAGSAPITWSFRTGSAPGAPERVFTDDFASGAGAWTAEPDTGAAPSAEDGALLLTAARSDAAFTVAGGRPAAWIDEAGAIAFRARVSGTAVPAALVVRVTTAAGRTYSADLPVTPDAWTSARVTVAGISPDLVGETLTRVAVGARTSGPGELRLAVDDVIAENDLSAYAAPPPTTPSSAARPLPPETLALVRAYADQIVASSHPDGAITVAPVGGNAARIEPYFANYAALGLLRAYQVTGERRYRDTASRWLDWYAAHMNADGTVDKYTGSYPDWTAAGDYDSADSYAATYILANWKLAELARNDGQRKKAARRVADRVARAWGALDSVFLVDGVTIAKDSYRIRYTMDNAETWLGEVAYAKLAGLAGDAAETRLALHHARRVMYALRNRFPIADPAGDYLAWYVSPGARHGGLDGWYPHALANVIPLAIYGGAGDAAHYARMFAHFETGGVANRPAGVAAAPHWGWWAQAAAATGRSDLADYWVAQAGPVQADSLAHACGYLTRVVTRDYDGTLWF